MYFDAHSDIWCDVTARRLKGETDVLRRRHLERLRKGGVEGSIFVIWVDPPYDVDYVKRTKEIMQCAKAEAEECDEIRIVHNYAQTVSYTHLDVYKRQIWIFVKKNRNWRTVLMHSVQEI